VSAQRDRSVVSAQRRSVHPNVPGVPWWGAVLIAVTATAIGFAFDAGGGKELTHVYAALYVIGCIAAVLMVRRSGIFTAVVQPPMILFVTVPGAYFLFHRSDIKGLKDILINCGYPLIERFPLMVFTSGLILLIGLGRWFVGSSKDSAEAEPTATDKPSLLTGITAKIAGYFGAGDDDEELAPTRRHAERSKPPRSAQPSKAAKRSEPTRSRRARPPLIDDDVAPERPRRSRPVPSWESDEPIDYPRRRSSAARTSRNPYERREPYERRAPHDRRSRHESHDPFEPYEAPQRRRPGTNGAAVANGTHHPTSRVRYRGSPTDTEPRQDRPQHRSRSWEADSWEYDI
jgi:Domain of unknown function (DUF6542)